MTLPEAHLVYSGNSMVMANGHLVYARLLNPVGDSFFRKRYESSVSFADALAGMKAAAWETETIYGLAANSRSSQGGVDTWLIQSGCIRVDCSALTPDVEGEVAKYVKVDIFSYAPITTATYRIGWVTSDTEAPDATWNWLDLAPSVNITADGRYVLTTNVTLKKYFFVLSSFASYVEPAEEDGWSYGVVQEDAAEETYPGVRFAF
jgi:hypothetical protein